MNNSIFKSKIDCNKIIRVIDSINNIKQVECTNNLIENYRRIYGFGCEYNLLKLKLKYKKINI